METELSLNDVVIVDVSGVFGCKNKDLRKATVVDTPKPFGLQTTCYGVKLEGCGDKTYYVQYGYIHAILAKYSAPKPVDDFSVELLYWLKVNLRNVGLSEFVTVKAEMEGDKAKVTLTAVGVDFHCLVAKGKNDFWKVSYLYGAKQEAKSSVMIKGIENAAGDIFRNIVETLDYVHIVQLFTRR